jgi:hypothetical protein
VAHDQETSVYGDPHRSSRPIAGGSFVSATRIVLMPNDADLAGKILAAANRHQIDTRVRGPVTNNGACDKHLGDKMSRIDTTFGRCK